MGEAVEYEASYRAEHDARLRPAAAVGPAGSRRVAVVIPCYRASTSIVAVIARIGPEVEHIYVIDDGCPEKTGELVTREVSDPRVAVLKNDRNLGVGGATKRGYDHALREGAEIIVKLDADGQMDPVFIPLLVSPIAAEVADYAKGNRFAQAHRMPAGSAPEGARRMPTTRRIGNNLLSFLHKGVTGYWNILDPTNGYTAIHRRALESIDLKRVADGYFFETDILFQLNLAGAVVQDVPLPARYAGEVSSLAIGQVIAQFPGLALKRFLRRIGIKYYLQDFNVASLEMLLGLPMVLLGSAYGAYRWIAAVESGVPNTAGTVMVAALPIIIGFQLLLSAVSYDVFHTPKEPICRRSRPR